MTSLTSRWVCCLVVAICLLCTVGRQTAQAQAKRDWSGYKPTLTGGKWVVVRQYITPSEVFRKPDERVADFPTEADAESYAKYLGDQEYERVKPGLMRFGYSVTKREDLPEASVDAPEVGTPKIRPVDPKFVDLGPLKTVAKKKIALDGKVGKGKIGDDKVTINFKKGGAMTITGEVVGEGKWEATEGGVVIETKYAVYRGVLKDDVLSGQRFWKDNTMAMTKWEIKLESSSADAGRAIKLEGTKWRLSEESSTAEYHFEKDGVLTSYFPNTGDRSADGTYAQTGNTVDIKTKEQGVQLIGTISDDGKKLTMIFNGNKYTGNQFTLDLIKK